MFEMLIGKNSNANDVSDGPPGVKLRGEQSVTGFINGLELASQIGLTAGVSQYSNESWLHFVLDDVELYVAKKPYRYNLSWNHIDARGAAFGSRTVVIDGRTYKVRLPKSVATGDIHTGPDGHDQVGTYGSEWNRLMYPVHSGNHTSNSNPSPVSGEGLRFGTLAQYTDADLLVYNTAGNGSYSWCQETPIGNAGSRVSIGSYGVSCLVWIPASAAGSTTGWRPVLELVE